MSTPPAPTQELTQLQHHHQRPGRRCSSRTTGRLPLEALAVADLQRRYPTPVTTDTGHTPMLQTEP